MVDERAHRGFRENMRLLFEDLSFAQVAAGALAAVTSMLFASQIGIAGSVIGRGGIGGGDRVVPGV